MHLATFKWISSFLYKTIARKKKDTRNILLLQSNDKYKNALQIYSIIFTHICIG